MNDGEATGAPDVAPQHEASDAHSPTERAATAVDTLEIRALSDLAELRACEAVQQDVWGFDPLETVPASQLRAVLQAGGMLLGALVDGRVVGFAYGFPSLPLDRWEQGLGIHSHMVAVRPAVQRSGVGRSLKWAQRRWCLERGMAWMAWTFDPLQAKNAHLNFHHLGARSHLYLENFYGVVGGPLAGNGATDRRLAFWDLRSVRVETLARHYQEGRPPDAVEAEGAAWLLERGPDGEPKPGSELGGALRVRVAVPEDATALLRDRPELALRWRLAVRECLQRALAAGFAVEAFVGGGYLLVREDGQRTT